MHEQLENYLSKKPEIIFEWHDPQSEAKGWVVINSLKGGAAGGGTRMRKGLTVSEVVDLAKTMEIKFNVCGPGIGGAKSGIDFDPADPRKEAVLRRWYQAVQPLLKHYYGTAGDLNVDEKKEVSPILSSMGIMHPQEGVLEGHFHYSADKKQQILERLKSGCDLPVRSKAWSPMPDTDEYTTIDLITGFGVFESIRAYYQIFRGIGLSGKRIMVQGWGNVGAAAGWYLSQAGARIVAIQDKDGYIVKNGGFSFEEVTRFMNEKVNNTLVSKDKIRSAFPVELLDELDLDVFVPAAASKLVKPDFVEGLRRNGLELISSGANVPFSEEGNLFGPLTRLVDGQTALIPDFIANCGVARLFAYLMENQGPCDENGIFNDITETMFTAIQGLYNLDPKPLNLTARALAKYAMI